MYTPQDRRQNPYTDDHLLAAAGVYPGITVMNKFGRNAAVAAGVEEEIWDGSAAYSFPATALMTKINTTIDQATLQGEVVEIQGLNAAWELTVQTAILDDSDTSTLVTLGTPLIRVFRMKLLSAVTATTSITLVNDADNVIYGNIEPGNQQTQMAIYTVPLGKTAYVTNYWAHHNPKAGNQFTANPIKLKVRDNANGYAASLAHVVGVSENGGFQHFMGPYIKVPAQYDIYLTSQPTGADADISAGFDLVLVDD